MSTGSVSDAEDLQDVTSKRANVKCGRPLRETARNAVFAGRDTSEDDLSADEGFEVKVKRVRPLNDGRRQVRGQKDGRQSQRNAANARERARMRVLSKAFSRLKTSLPWVPADTKLSKLDTLRLASSYISHLRQLLHDDRLQNNFVHPANLTWPFAVSGRAEDTKDISATTRLCGTTA